MTTVLANCVLKLNVKTYLEKAAVAKYDKL